jgi:hypothetical protein
MVIQDPFGMYFPSYKSSCTSSIHVPPPLSANPPQDQSSLLSIAGDLRLLRDAKEHQHLRTISNEEDKKNSSNSWRKLPEEVQTMILQAQQIPTSRS